MKAVSNFAMSVFFAFVGPAFFNAMASDDEWLGQDKALHFGASIALESVAYWTLRQGVGWSRAGSLTGAAAMAIAAGLAKEFCDDSFSAKDMVWNGAGVGVGSCAWFLLDARENRLLVTAGRQGVMLCYDRRF